MASRFLEDSDSSENETPNDLPSLSPTRRPSIIPFQFVDVEAVESDDNGGDVNDNDTDDNEGEGENENDTLNGFITVDNDIEFEDDINSSNDENDYVKLNHEPEEKESELLNDRETPNGNEDEDKQKLLEQLTKSKPKEDINNKKRKRYYDLLTDDNTDNIINDNDSSSEFEDDDSDDDSDDSDDSDESDDEEESNENEMNVDDDTEVETKTNKHKLSDLSKLEFEKLLSHTMVNLALKLEENDNKNMSQHINPFANMDDQISLEINNELNMSELLSFISDDEYDNYNNNKDDIDSENINNPKDFETIIPFEKSHNILPDPTTSSSNHPSNLRKSKLNTTMLSNRDGENNTFIQEEIRLAENTMKQAITSKMNIERKNFAPPLSSLDPRVRKRKGGDNAGKKWFKMPAGKLTPQNKLHFLMLKYRHMLYRDYKPAKVKDNFVPKYFEMGTIIEGPTEFYSSRLTKKQRRSSWANEYLTDPSTKQWLEEKTRRAQRRIRKPGRKFWAPMKKLNVNNRYKLRKKIIKNRKRQSWNHKNIK